MVTEDSRQAYTPSRGHPLGDMRVALCRSRASARLLPCENASAAGLIRYRSSVEPVGFGFHRTLCPARVQQRLCRMGVRRRSGSRVRSAWRCEAAPVAALADPADQPGDVGMPTVPPLAQIVLVLVQQRGSGGGLGDEVLGAAGEGVSAGCIPVQAQLPRDRPHRLFLARVASGRRRTFPHPVGAGNVVAGAEQLFVGAGYAVD